MTAAEFVYWINQNAARITEYSNGGDGSNGKCDCIGLIIGAWRLSGNKWPWVHGSNYTARYLTDDLVYDQPLKLGDLVYKARKPGDKYYDLPDRYKDGTDLLDYYHVGVVTCENPLQITHCTVGGIKRDTKRGQWKYSGQFSKVDYESEVIPVGKAYVTGGKLNLRKTYSTMGTVIDQIPNGSEVEVLEQVNDKWSKVTWHGETGPELADEIAAKVMEKLRPDLEEMDGKLKTANTRLDGHDRDIETLYKRTDQDRTGIRTLVVGMLALLNHELHNGNAEELNNAQKAMNKYLIDKE